MKPKQISKTLKVSQSYIYKVKSGEILTDKAYAISLLLEIETHLKDIFADERFWDMCECAVARSRSIEVRKFAVRCQHISEIIKKENQISETENQKDEMP